MCRFVSKRRETSNNVGMGMPSFNIREAKDLPELFSIHFEALIGVPDLLNIKGMSGHLWRFIFIFANGASYT